MLRSAGARRLRKTLRRCTAGAKNSPEKCLVDLGRDTRTSTQSHRLVRRKDASWSLNWPSGANLLARKQHMYFFSFGPRGAGIRRLTGRQKIQGNQYQKERLIRHTSQSGTFFGASVTTVYLFFFVIGRVSTRLDYSLSGPLTSGPLRTDNHFHGHSFLRA